MRSIARHLSRSYSTRSGKAGWDDKLRILFCGTDEFSIESLQGLHIVSKTSDQISSIDVVTKKDQRTGRGLRRVTPPPIKKIALDLDLPLHQIDTFTGWTPPDINLIVAVSFGLLIPPRVLNASKYGGLNVHPSLLPDLRGAAPIQWAIMLGRQQTGVSVQTLHPTKFDEGVILDQTPVPIPVPATTTYSALSARLGPLGADILVKAIRNRLYLPPYQEVPLIRQAISPAPKLTAEHKAMDFSLGRHEICQRSRATGPLHAFAEDTDGRKVRIKIGAVYTAMSNMDLVDEIRDLSSEQARLRSQIPIGVPWAFVRRNYDVMSCLDSLRVNTRDGIVCISDITVEGKQSGPATQRAAQAKLFGSPQQLAGVNEFDPGSIFYQFLKPLTLECPPWPTASQLI